MNWTMIGIDFFYDHWVAVALNAETDYFALYTLTTPNEPGTMWGFARTKGTLAECQEYVAKNPSLTKMVLAQHKAAKERKQKVS